MREGKHRGDNVQGGEGEGAVDAEDLRGGAIAANSIASYEHPVAGRVCPASGQMTIGHDEGRDREDDRCREGDRDREDDRDHDGQHHDAAFARGVAAAVEFPC